MSTTSGPGRFHATMAPSDTVNQATPFTSIWVGVLGNIALVDYSGNVVTYSNVPVGTFPYGGVRVNVTNTTATGLIAVWS